MIQQLVRTASSAASSAAYIFTIGGTLNSLGEICDLAVRILKESSLTLWNCQDATKYQEHKEKIKQAFVKLIYSNSPKQFNKDNINDLKFSLKSPLIKLASSITVFVLLNRFKQPIPPIANKVLSLCNIRFVPGTFSKLWTN